MRRFVDGICSVALLIISVVGIMKIGKLNLPLQIVVVVSATIVIALTAYDFHISNKRRY